MGRALVINRKTLHRHIDFYHQIITIAVLSAIDAGIEIHFPYTVNLFYLCKDIGDIVYVPIQIKTRFESCYDIVFHEYTFQHFTTLFQIVYQRTFSNVITSRFVQYTRDTTLMTVHPCCAY